MTLDPDVDPGAARAALATVAGRLSALIRSSTQPDAPAIGEWNVADTAVHVGNAWDVLPRLAAGEMEPPIGEVWELAAFTTGLTRAATDRDLGAIADRIDAASAAFLAAAAAAGDAPVPWLVRGVSMPMTTFVCHLLNESLVHGWDIAHAQGRPWEIDPAHARMVFAGFLFPVLSRLPTTAVVIPERVAGLQACYDLRVRDGIRIFLRFEDGAVHIEPPSDRRVDCHISAEAAALMLVIWGRRSQWPAVFAGKLLSWGRRPLLGPRLRTLLRNP
jgi:uncharacterized protein (TIGR03083 family)